jgi:hypothetical protein
MNTMLVKTHERVTSLGQMELALRISEKRSSATTLAPQ